MNQQLTLLLMLMLASRLFAASPQDLIGQMLAPEVVLANADAIGLSNEQQQSLQAAIAPLQREMRPAHELMRSFNSELVTLLVAPKPDEATVLAKFAELEAAESKMKALRLKMTLAVKSVLTAEQQKKTLSLKESSIAMPRPGDGQTITAKLKLVRDGIARMQNEGRDTSQVRALWTEFQQRAELRHHQLAAKTLDEALRLVEAPTK